MKNAKQLFFLFILSLLTFHTNAQNGQNEVQFVITEPAVCTVPYSILVDVEVRAAAAPGFFMSEQNYRFSFNDNALANPTIAKEILTGFVPGGSGPLGYTLYSPHNLVGSLDSVVSYNLELQGGDGVFVSPDEWIKVGQLGFDVLDSDACFDLLWHPQAVFPPTFVGEIYIENGATLRTNTRESVYGNLSNCMTDVCILPVEMTSFYGEERDCKVHLTWETATETNSHYFVVERSIDGIEFAEIERVSAAGESQTPLTYNFSDIGVSLQTYYRLKQFDFDGTYDYSDVIKVKATCIEDAGDIVEVYPNPVRSNMNIKLYSNTNENANIVVMNIEGKVVFNKAITLTEGPNVLDVSVGDLASGAYFVSIQGGHLHSNAHKFIKIND